MLAKNKASAAASPSRKKPERKNEHYHWSKEDLEQLRQLYPGRPNAEIAKVLKRTKMSVDKKAHELSLRKEQSYRSTIASQNSSQRKNTWQAKEIAQLKKIFNKHTYAELALLLGRNAQSIQSKASRLGLWKYKADSRR